MFFSTRSHEVNRIVRATPQTILETLHDPDVFFRLNPLVVSVTANPEPPHSYTVVDELLVLGCFKTTTTFTCVASFSDDGIECDIEAALGTRTRCSFHVKQGQDEGTSEIVYKVVVQGLSFLLPYIDKTQQKAHQMLLDRLGRHSEGESSDSVSTKVPQRLGSPWQTYRSLVMILLVTSTLPIAPRQKIIASALGISTLLYTFSAKRGDPYASFHLALNKQPGEDPTTPPSTEWLNVGCWKDTDIFPDACRALALKLSQAAKRREGDRVLDVGHGTGESLVFMLSDRSTPRPSRIVGITSLPLHHERSKERIAALQSSTQVNLYLGDAVYRASSIGHPLSPQSKETFDCVLALDCAYHFKTRRDFLSQSLVKLSPGGRIALADMCFEPHYQWVAKLAEMLIPRENIVSMDQYMLTMKNVGFAEVEVEDITSNVFPKFLEFLRGKGLQWWIFSSAYSWFLYAMGAKFVIVSGSRS